MAVELLPTVAMAADTVINITETSGVDIWHYVQIFLPALVVLLGFFGAIPLIVSRVAKGLSEILREIAEGTEDGKLTAEEVQEILAQVNLFKLLFAKKGK